MAKDKAKKSIFKRWWFWLLVVIVVGGIASAGGGNDQSSTSSDNGSKQSSTTAKADTKKAETKKTFGIGQEVKVGKVTYKINKKEVADQVGPTALPTKASGKYVVINVTLKNNGNEAVTVDSSFFNLKRGSKTYEADGAASMSANQGENGDVANSFFLQKVNPDSEITGNVVFDIAPDVASATDLQLQVQTGVFGTEKEVINLQ